MSTKPIRLPSGHPKIFDTMKIEILRMENGDVTEKMILPNL